MDLIAENGHRKWAYGAAGGVMVTAVIALALAIPVPPAMAAKPLNLGSFFDFPPKHRRVHPEKNPESIPLPRPRPDPTGV